MTQTLVVPSDLLALSLTRLPNGHIPTFATVKTLETVTPTGKLIRLEKSQWIFSAGSHVNIRAIAYAGYDAETDTVFYYSQR